MSGTTTAVHANPFWVLQVSTRDDARRIVAAAEERSLLIDHDACQKARLALTNPRKRLSAEMAWMPGVAPRAAEELAAALRDRPLSVGTAKGLPELARANLMAATFGSNIEEEPAESVAETILDFVRVVEAIDVNDVMRDINEDRAVAGFPEVRSSEVVDEELAERRKTYCAELRNLLDRMDPVKLVETITRAVLVATEDGVEHGPPLLDDLVDAYEIEAQGFLQKEQENIAVLVRSAREAAPRGEAAVAAIIDKLEPVVRNWDRVAQPVQINAKSRGIMHRQSSEVALELRDLGIAMNNEHGMLDQAHRMTELLRQIFAELPEVVERLEEDAQAITNLRKQAAERARNEAEWARSITFRAGIGLMFKSELAISPEGIQWNGQTVQLDSITRVRWGAVRHSVNGIPTGTDYTIAYGDNTSEQIIRLRNESTYTGFLEALWRGVCVRLVFQMLEALAEGGSLPFGGFTVQDSAVTLIEHRFFAANETVRLGWREVQIWSADGKFTIGQTTGKKTSGSASYIDDPNTHIIEHIIRGAFKKGANKLSDYLKD